MDTAVKIDHLKVALLAASATTLGGIAQAQELSIQPRVSLGYQSYSFELSDQDNELFNSDVSYLFGGLGVSAQVGRFFVDLYGQTNLTEAEDDSDFLGVATRTDKVDRYEVNLTAGYAITSQFSAFTGVKYANTKINEDIEDDATGGDLLDADNKLEMDYYGPFLGASYAIPVQPLYGSIVLNGSVAYLFGNVALDSTIVDNVNAVVTEIVADNDGEAVGANIGIAWAAGFGSLLPGLEPLSYTVGVDYSTYTFEEDGSSGDLFEEETLRGRVDLKYRF
jgi:hypothetical protein